MKKAAALPLLLAVLLAVAGCSGPPAQPPVEQPTQRGEIVVPAAEPEDEVERLLALAARSEGAAAHDATLQAAAELLVRGDSARAGALLDDLETRSLSSPQWIRHSILRARVELAAGAPEAALARLENPALQDESAGAGPALQVDLAFARADAFAALHRHLDSARERTRVQAWLSEDAARRDNTRAIFAALAGAGIDELEREAAAAASDDWRGWLELVTIARELRRGADAQLAELARWEQRYALIAPLQPATRELLPQLRERITRPEKVALLLPLSGTAAATGAAVLNGYLAEHLRQLAAGEQAPPAAVIDTAAFAGGFAAAYAGAVADGARMIIGPLLKEDLATFGPALQPAVPTLALNFSDAASTDGTMLVSFGLDGADEVAQLVAAARAGGYAHALVLADNTDSSQRQVAEFERLWPQHGARVLGTLRLGDLNEFRRRFEQALLFEQSRQRSAALSRVLGIELVTEPRRRQDLDLVVMFAGPVAARSLRPLVSFLYAGDLPIWASSQANAARTDPRNDRDLEGVRFLDLPWFSGAERPLRDALGSSVPPGGLQRLAALGADAYRLQSRIGLLEWMNEMNLGGATGELTLDGRRKLHRQSQWYVFRDGLAVPEQRRAALATVPATTGRSTEGETPWTDAPTPAQPPSDAPPRTTP